MGFQKVYAKKVYVVFSVPTQGNPENGFSKFWGRGGGGPNLEVMKGNISDNWLFAFNKYTL